MCETYELTIASLKLGASKLARFKASCEQSGSKLPHSKMPETGQADRSLNNSGFLWRMV